MMDALYAKAEPCITNCGKFPDTFNFSNETFLPVVVCFTASSKALC
jgi:hypothetical protein